MEDVLTLDIWCNEACRQFALQLQSFIQENDPELVRTMRSRPTVFEESERDEYATPISGRPNSELLTLVLYDTGNSRAGSTLDSFLQQIPSDRFVIVIEMFTYDAEELFKVGWTTQLFYFMRMFYDVPFNADDPEGESTRYDPVDLAKVAKRIKFIHEAILGTDTPEIYETPPPPRFKTPKAPDTEPLVYGTPRTPDTAPLVYGTPATPGTEPLVLLDGSVVLLTNVQESPEVIRVRGKAKRGLFLQCNVCEQKASLVCSHCGDTFYCSHYCQKLDKDHLF